MEKLLLELTSLPTAAGCEDRVINYIERWAKRRASVTLNRDRYGNLMLKRKGLGRRKRRPIVIAAHMDHPAFVVTKVTQGRIEAEFRGGVKREYFDKARVRIFHKQRSPQFGKITKVVNPAQQQGDLRVTVASGQELCAEPGDVMTWDIEPSYIDGGRLYAPACDNLAGVAAGLSAFEKLLRDQSPNVADVRLLLTRAEEVGFIGAIGVCRSGLLPRASRVIVLENSKSFTESPIGGGPIVRVGDRTSTFDPDLTYRVGRVAENLAARKGGFAWQRKLMPGGTCEASAYQSFGYTATCLCLPLGHYHNMNEDKQRIEAETIALSDYHGLIRLLVEVGKKLDDPKQSPALRDRLEDLFARRKYLLD